MSLWNMNIITSIDIYYPFCDWLLFQGNEKYDPKRCEVFQCDITKDNLTDRITSPDVDVATLIFVLSAIHPDKMVHAVRNIYQVGNLFFFLIFVFILL